MSIPSGPTAAEGVGTVVVELESGADTREVLDEVKSRIDAITTFPEETEKPIIQEALIRRRVITVAVYGDVEERALKAVAEQVREGLSELPDITQVELDAVRPYEISIEVSEDTLRQYGLTFDEVVLRSGDPRSIFPAARCEPARARSSCARWARPTGARSTGTSCCGRVRTAADSSSATLRR